MKFAKVDVKLREFSMQVINCQSRLEVNFTCEDVPFSLPKHMKILLNPILFRYIDMITMSRDLLIWAMNLIYFSILESLCKIIAFILSDKKKLNFLYIFILQTLSLYIFHFLKKKIFSITLIKLKLESQKPETT